MIYVVDDTADYRFLVQQVFKLYLPRYPLRLFADGLDLIEQIEQSASPPSSALPVPGLLVLDMDMPKLNGLQTLKRLNQYDGWQTIPVVIMSNRSDEEFVKAAYEGGTKDYIAKPINLFALKEVMTQLCRQWLDT